MVRLLGLFLFLGILTGVYGIEIYVAPFLVMGEEEGVKFRDEERFFGERYFEEIRAADFKRLLEVRYLEAGKLSGITSVRSTLDAREVCEKYRIDYLVYGFYRKGYRVVEAEVRLYDRVRGEVRKTFYGKGESDEYMVICKDLAERFVGYMYGLFGVEAKKPVVRLFSGFGGLELVFGVGYWSAVGKWFDILSGVVGVEVGLLVQPDEELLWLGDILFMYRFGICGRYSFGVSRPEVESFYFHNVMFRAPVELCMLFFERHMVWLGIGIYYGHDFIYQDRVFGSGTWLNSGTLGSGLYVGYEYWGGSRREYAFGGRGGVELDFYENILCELEIKVYFSYRFEIGGKEK